VAGWAFRGCRYGSCWVGVRSLSASTRCTTPTLHLFVLVCRWFVVGLSLVCRWFVVGLSLVCRWFVVGLSLVCRWFVVGLSLVCRWIVGSKWLDRSCIHLLCVTTYTASPKERRETRFEIKKVKELVDILYSGLVVVLLADICV